MHKVKPLSTSLDDVNYLVLGLGVSGYSVARYLLAHGYRCKLQDRRDIPPFLHRLKAEFARVDFRSQAVDAELIEWADTLVVSPGISIHEAAIERAADLGKPVIGDIELFAQLVTKPVIAITGSNGKTTVTTLVGLMLVADGREVGIGGNIGTAAMDLLEQPADYYVLELSSYQLETTTSLKPRIAALLNLSQDHLDRYAGYADYIQAKRRIYDNASQCVSNYDDEVTRHDDSDVCFSLAPGAPAEFHLLDDNGFWLARNQDPWLSVDELRISGKHNWANCLAAMAIAYSLGIAKTAIVSALKAFTGIPHRSQWVAEIDAVEWINDSKATNVGAAKASIEGRSRPVILIAGGQAKDADLSIITETLRQKVKLILLLGVDADRMQQAWRQATRIERVDNMQQAVARAYEEAVSGDCVLLAPACASFDMYQKFEARGDDFMQLVKGLADD